MTDTTAKKLEKKLAEIVERHSSPTEVGSTPSTIVYRSIGSEDLRAAVREAADAALDAILKDAPEHDIGPQHDPFMQGNIRHNLSCTRCWLEKRAAALRREKTREGQ